MCEKQKFLSLRDLSGGNKTERPCRNVCDIFNTDTSLRLTECQPNLNINNYALETKVAFARVSEWQQKKTERPCRNVCDTSKLTYVFLNIRRVT